MTSRMTCGRAQVRPSLPARAFKAARTCGAVLAALVLLTRASPVAAADAYPPSPGADTPVMSLPTRVGDLRYTPGRGLRVGDTGLTLGGYVATDLTRDEGGPARFTVEDAGLFFIWDPTPRLHLFSELDVVDQDEPAEPRRTFVTPRLYGDVAALDWLNLRVGKFLTPVGRWNLIYARPLVLTTSRPLVTELPFDPFTTGVMLFGSVFPRTGTLTYSVYGQVIDQFSAEPEPQPVDRSVGGRLEYASLGGWSVGGSYLAFTAPRVLPEEGEAADRGGAAAGDGGGWRHLTGVDALWQRGPFEVMGEFAFQEPARGAGRQWGLYVQPVAEVLPRFYLVGRYEHFEQPAPEPAVNIGVVGLAYKPWPFVVLKGEYLFADHRAEESPPGVRTSFTVLF